MRAPGHLDQSTDLLAHYVAPLDTALATARRTLASVAERAAQRGYYSGARTDIINAHADMRAALDLLIMAAAGDDGPMADPGSPA